MKNYTKVEETKFSFPLTMTRLEADRLLFVCKTFLEQLRAAADYANLSRRTFFECEHLGWSAL